MKRSPLLRKTALKRKKPLARISKKRKREAVVYGVKRKAFLRNHRYCQACPKFSLPMLKANQVHHTKGRTGLNYLDVSTWLAVCGPCHELIHQSPNTARELGLLA